MTYREEVVRRLQALDAQRQAAQFMEETLQILTPEERLVVQMMCICPEKYAARKLCQLLCVEQASVYRKKDRALGKLAKALGIDACAIMAAERK